MHNFGEKGLKLKVERLNNWLAKRIVQYWQEDSKVTLEVQDAVEDLCLNLEPMKQFLNQQAENHTALNEEIVKEIAKLFAQINNSFSTEHVLHKKKDLLLNLLDDNTTSGYCYQYALSSNFRSLQALTAKKLQQLIFHLSKTASPLPQQFFLELLLKQLNKWSIEVVKQEIKNSQIKQKTALSSFNKTLSLKKSPKKLDICQRAITIAYESRINSDIYSLIAQIATQTIEQLEIHISNLKKTNLLLTKSSEKLGNYNQSEITVYSSFFIQLESLVSFKELQCEFSSCFKQPFELWGVSTSISSDRICEMLTERLYPITERLYVELYQEVLGLPLPSHTECDNTTAKSDRLLTSNLQAIERIAVKSESNNQGKSSMQNGSKQNIYRKAQGNALQYKDRHDIPCIDYWLE